VIPFAGGTGIPATSGADQFDLPVWLRSRRLAFARMRPGRELLVSALDGSPPRPFGPPSFSSASVPFLFWLPDSGYVLQALSGRIRVDEEGRVQDSLSTRPGLGALIAVTPDGQEWWFRAAGDPGDPTNAYTIQALQLATGGVTRVTKIQGNFRPLGWRQGALYIALGRSSTGGTTIWSVDRGKEPVRVAELPAPCSGGPQVSMSAGGGRFVCGSISSRTDIWLLEGFRPDR